MLLLAILALGGAEVYRWIGADGIVHFSDRPYPGAERVVIRAAPASPTQRAPASENAAPAESQDEAFRYDAVTILSPAQDEVLWNIEGQLEVSATVEPTLRPGHTLQLYLDNRPAATLPPGLNRTRLSEVARGAHSLRAEILDESGASLLQSPAVGFVVRQTSIANPQNPVLSPTPR